LRKFDKVFILIHIKIFFFLSYVTSNNFLSIKIAYSLSKFVKNDFPSSYYLSFTQGLSNGYGSWFSNNRTSCNTRLSCSSFTLISSGRSSCACSGIRSTAQPSKNIVQLIISSKFFIHLSQQYLFTFIF